ncbi:hypothetical protein BB559_003441 [Furculomyces boomerangus]|uniref:Uncharacterized protein n=1 Tax=Furculomyces boomerangus TaxID=61424 RepID=A0A2T9YL81_9FUNG|nr:hypothetical protein BB559_003441 [Furculomyces boomerangus]
MDNFDPSKVLYNWDDFGLNNNQNASNSNPSAQNEETTNSNSVSDTRIPDNLFMDEMNSFFQNFTNLGGENNIDLSANNNYSNADLDEQAKLMDFDFSKILNEINLNLNNQPDLQSTNQNLIHDPINIDTQNNNPNNLETKPDSTQSNTSSNDFENLFGSTRNSEKSAPSSENIIPQDKTIFNNPGDHIYAGINTMGNGINVPDSNALSLNTAEIKPNDINTPQSQSKGIALQNIADQNSNNTTFGNTDVNSENIEITEIKSSPLTINSDISTHNHIINNENINFQENANVLRDNTQSNNLELFQENYLVKPPNTINTPQLISRVQSVPYQTNKPKNDINESKSIEGTPSLKSTENNNQSLINNILNFTTKLETVPSNDSSKNIEPYKQEPSLLQNNVNGITVDSDTTKKHSLQEEGKVEAKDKDGDIIMDFNKSSLPNSSNESNIFVKEKSENKELSQISNHSNILDEEKTKTASQESKKMRFLTPEPCKVRINAYYQIDNFEKYGTILGNSLTIGVSSVFNTSGYFKALTRGVDPVTVQWSHQNVVAISWPQKIVDSYKKYKRLDPRDIGRQTSSLLTTKALGDRRDLRIKGSPVHLFQLNTTIKEDDENSSVPSLMRIGKLQVKPQDFKAPYNIKFRLGGTGEVPDIGISQVWWNEDGNLLIISEPSGRVVVFENDISSSNWKQTQRIDFQRPIRAAIWLTEKRKYTASFGSSSSIKDDITNNINNGDNTFDTFMDSVSIKLSPGRRRHYRSTEQSFAVLTCAGRLEICDKKLIDGQRKKIDLPTPESSFTNDKIWAITHADIKITTSWDLVVVAEWKCIENGILKSNSSFGSNVIQVYIVDGEGLLTSNSELRVKYHLTRDISFGDFSTTLLKLIPQKTNEVERSISKQTDLDEDFPLIVVAQSKHAEEGFETLVSTFKIESTLVQLSQHHFNHLATKINIHQCENIKFGENTKTLSILNNYVPWTISLENGGVFQCCINHKSDHNSEQGNSQYDYFEKEIVAEFLDSSETIRAFSSTGSVVLSILGNHTSSVEGSQSEDLTSGRLMISNIGFEKLQEIHNWTENTNFNKMAYATTELALRMMNKLDLKDIYILLDDFSKSEKVNIMFWASKLICKAIGTDDIILNPEYPNSMMFVRFLGFCSRVYYKLDETALGSNIMFLLHLSNISRIYKSVGQNNSFWSVFRSNFQNNNHNLSTLDKIYPSSNGGVSSFLKPFVSIAVWTIDSIAVLLRDIIIYMKQAIPSNYQMTYIHQLWTKSRLAVFAFPQFLSLAEDSVLFVKHILTDSNIFPSDQPLSSDPSVPFTDNIKAEINENKPFGKDTIEKLVFYHVEIPFLLRTNPELMFHSFTGDLFSIKYHPLSQQENTQADKDFAEAVSNKEDTEIIKPAKIDGIESQDDNSQTNSEIYINNIFGLSETVPSIDDSFLWFVNGDQYLNSLENPSIKADHGTQPQANGYGADAFDSGLMDTSLKYDASDSSMISKNVSNTNSLGNEKPVPDISGFVSNLQLMNSGYDIDFQILNDSQIPNMAYDIITKSSLKDVLLQLGKQRRSFITKKYMYNKDLLASNENENGTYGSYQTCFSAADVDSEHVLDLEHPHTNIRVCGCCGSFSYFYDHLEPKPKEQSSDIDSSGNAVINSGQESIVGKRDLEESTALSKQDMSFCKLFNFACFCVCGGKWIFI